MSTNLSTEECLERLIGTLAQGLLSDALPSVGAIRLCVASDRATKAQDPRVVVTARMQSDDQTVVIDGTIAKVYAISVVIEVPSSDSRAQPADYQTAIDQTGSQLVSPTPAQVQTIDPQFLELFDLLVISEVTGSTYEVDNDHILYGVAVSAIVHRINS